jgi:hypothetical protein
MIILHCSEDDLGQHLYYAYISASLVLHPEPHAAAPDIQWSQLPEDQRRLWQEAARRLIALHGKDRPDA